MPPDLSGLLTGIGEDILAWIEALFVGVLPVLMVFFGLYAAQMIGELIGNFVRSFVVGRESDDDGDDDNRRRRSRDDDDDDGGLF